MVFIHRHSSNTRLDLSICGLYSALVSTEVLCAAPSELGISRHLACAVRTPQGLTGTISPSGEKPYKGFFCRPQCIFSPTIFMMASGLYRNFFPAIRVAVVSSGRMTDSTNSSRTRRSITCSNMICVISKYP